MKKFESILLCTDLDGTLARDKNIAKRDIDAINYFKDNGGTFTLCTGRMLEYLEDLFKTVEPNTYTITLNGAKIIDHKSGEIIYSSHLQQGYTKAAEIPLKYSEYIKDIFIYSNAKEYYKRTSPESFRADCIDRDKLVHKIVFTFKDEEITKIAQKEIINGFSDKYACLRSWSTGLELLDINSTKGEAVLRLKEKLSKRILITAGDFENDMPMIKAADIGYAVGDAIDSLKCIADRITVPFNQNPIASIIEELASLP